jgi:ATP-dependent exoDNAse (exonuclease V) beta subunit
VTSEERASLADAATAVARGVAAWIAMMRQPEVVQLLESGERFYELPFSMLVSDAAPRIVRGNVDCLIRHPDGSMTVVEFKTGRPRPGHQVQLEAYVRAVQGLFPQAGVIGRLIYPVGSTDQRHDGRPPGR